MRLFLIFFITAFVGVLPLQAQIKTYDIKRIPASEDDPAGIGDLQQISPTRTLALTSGWYGYSFLIAINNEGMIEQKWRTDFKPGSAAFYQYDHQSNTLSLIIMELIPPSLKKEQTRLILLDSNLKLKSNIVLDSMQYVSGYVGLKGITLLDSTILWMTSSNPTAKGIEQKVFRISRDGRITSRTSIVDTAQYISYEPLFQLPSSEILFGSLLYDPKTKDFTSYLCKSDTALHFDSKPLISNLYFRSLIRTSDSGIALAYYVSNASGKAALVKYDKDFQKQWTAYVPGDRGAGAIHLSLIESNNGGYYIATSAMDSVAPINHPEYKNDPECFQDILLSRVDASGKIIFSAYYGSELCNEEPYSMIQDYADGGIVIAGDYSSPSWNPICESICTNSYTGWLFKVDTLGEPAKRKVVTNVAEEIGISKAVRLFPNPTSGILTVEFDRADYFTSIEIVDINGIILQSLHLKPNHQHRANIDISAFPSGNYFCRIRSQSFSITRPFVVQK